MKPALAMLKINNPEKSSLPLAFHPPPLLHNRRIQFRGHDDQRNKHSNQHQKIHPDAESARAAGDHQCAEEVNLVGEGVDVGDDFEPGGHDRNRVDGVAGEEEGHGHDLADAHEPFARPHQAGDHEREGRKERRAEHDGDEHSAERERRPVQLNARDERHQIDDGRLRYGAHSRRDRFAEDERAARGGAGEQLLQNAEVFFPDDVDAVEDRDEEHALREDAWREEAEVVEVAGGDGAHPPEHLAEDQQPERGLDRAAQDFRRVAAQLGQLGGDDGRRVAQEPGGVELVSPAVWPSGGRG